MSAKRTSEQGIEIKNLTKRYGAEKTLAVNDVSLSVAPGEVYGFLGPNGAGKSTTIKLLMDFIRPTSGSASILGYDTVRDSLEIKKHVGYLSGDIAMYSQMTGAQFLAYMHELQPYASEEYFKSLLNRLNVNMDKKIQELSRGNRQKIAIVQAFMHQPDVLILDEPTSGLDPLMQEVFYELIAEARERQAAVFMSSHIISEVQRTCDRIGIIRSGRLVRELSMDELADQKSQRFIITFGGQIPLDELTSIPGVEATASGDDSVRIVTSGDLSKLFAVLAKHRVKKLETENIDLENEFISLYKDEEEAK